jgi:hypothetical protein
MPHAALGVFASAYHSAGGGGNPPVLVSEPTVDFGFDYGEVTDNGVWSGDEPITITYQWGGDIAFTEWPLNTLYEPGPGRLIPGATNPRIEYTTDYEGRKLTDMGGDFYWVIVIATNSAGSSFFSIFDFVNPD